MASRARPHRGARGRRVRLTKHAELVAAIQAAPAVSLGTTCWRHIRLGRDPLAAAGARFQGGRWNPPNSFSVLYLATDKATVSAEFHRLVARQGLSPESFLPRAMYRYEIDLVGLLDLTQVAARDAVKITDQELSANDMSVCQAVGEAAYACRRSGIIAPSATGDGTVVALFPDCLTTEEAVTAGDYEVREAARDVPGS